MTLAGVYGFWKYVSKLERRKTRRYLEMFYALKYRDLVSVVETLDSLVGIMVILACLLLDWENWEKLM